MRRTKATIRVLACAGVAALLAAGCSRAGGGQAASGTTPTAAASQAAGSASGSASGSGFGTLSDVCHGGSASGNTDQGVTASSIQVGVLSDYGFTKDPELLNAAKVFTSWCNANGGINGRKLVADIHDTQLMQVVPAMAKACASDFVLAGGSAAFDGLAVAQRLKCLLPDFDAQPVMPQNAGAGLEVAPYTFNFTYSSYPGYYKWLMSKYPDSASHIEVLSGASAITQVDASVVDQTVKADGGTVASNATFPATGVTNWTPYAEAVKNKGIKGLTFYGTPQWLAAFEQALDNIGYKLDWIDANTNAYGTAFTQIAGAALSQQTNYADLMGIYPVEKASSNPAVSKIVDLYKQYVPGQQVTLQGLQAISAWLLFAVSAESCGAHLTRSCVYNAALKQTAWTGGGINAPVNVAQPLTAPKCFDIEQATPSGWKPADGFTPNTGGAYSCGQNSVKLNGLPQPLQLSAVGQSLKNLK